MEKMLDYVDKVVKKESVQEGDKIIISNALMQFHLKGIEGLEFVSKEKVDGVRRYVILVEGKKKRDVYVRE